MKDDEDDDNDDDDDDVDEDDDDEWGGLGAVKRASCLFPPCLRFYRQRTLTQCLNVCICIFLFPLFCICIMFGVWTLFV